MDEVQKSRSERRPATRPSGGGAPAPATGRADWEAHGPAHHVHALSMLTRPRGEGRGKGGAIPDSPPWLGGGKAEA